MLKSVSVSHHISAKTEAGSPDWRKNFLACSPTEREETEKYNKIENLLHAKLKNVHTSLPKVFSVPEHVYIFSPEHVNNICVYFIATYIDNVLL